MDIEVQVWTVKDPIKDIEPEFVKAKKCKSLEDAQAYQQEKEKSGYQATILGIENGATRIL